MAAHTYFFTSHEGGAVAAHTYFSHLMKVVQWRLIHTFSHLMKVVQWVRHTYFFFFTFHEGVRIAGLEHTYLFTFHEGVRIAGLEHTCFFFTFHEGVPVCRIGAYIFFFTFHEAGSEVEMEAKVEAEAGEGKWFTIQFCRVHPSVAMPY